MDLFNFLKELLIKPVYGTSGGVVGKDLFKTNSPFYWDPSNKSDVGLSISFNNAISFIIGFLTVSAMLFFMFQFFIAAISWINAGGNDTNATSARMRIINSLLGLVVVVAGFAVVALVGSLLQIEIFSPLQPFLSPRTI